MKKIVLLSVATLVALQADAVQTIDLGAQVSNGSNTTSNSTYAANYSYMNNINTIKTVFLLSALGGKSQGIIVDERYSATLSGEKEIGEGWSAYATASWLKDRKILALSDMTSLALGVKKTLFKNANQQLDVNIGVANVDKKYYDATKDDNYTGLSEGFEYTYTISPSAKLYANVQATHDKVDFKDIYDVTGVAGIRMAISKNATLSYEYAKDYSHNLTGSEYSDRSILKVGYKF